MPKVFFLLLLSFSFIFSLLIPSTAGAATVSLNCDKDWSVVSAILPDSNPKTGEPYSVTINFDTKNRPPDWSNIYNYDFKIVTNGLLSNPLARILAGQSTLTFYLTAPKRSDPIDLALTHFLNGGIFPSYCSLGTINIDQADSNTAFFGPLIFENIPAENSIIRFTQKTQNPDSQKTLECTNKSRDNNEYTFTCGTQFFVPQIQDVPINIELSEIKKITDGKEDTDTGHFQLTVPANKDNYVWTLAARENTQQIKFSWIREASYPKIVLNPQTIVKSGRVDATVTLPPPLSSRYVVGVLSKRAEDTFQADERGKNRMKSSVPQFSISCQNGTCSPSAVSNDPLSAITNLQVTPNNSNQIVTFTINTDGLTDLTNFKGVVDVEYLVKLIMPSTPTATEPVFGRFKITLEQPAPTFRLNVQVAPAEVTIPARGGNIAVNIKIDNAPEGQYDVWLNNILFQSSGVTCSSTNKECTKTLVIPSDKLQEGENPVTLYKSGNRDIAGSANLRVHKEVNSNPTGVAGRPGNNKPAGSNTSSAGTFCDTKNEGAVVDKDTVDRLIKTKVWAEESGDAEAASQLAKAIQEKSGVLTAIGCIPTEPVALVQGAVRFSSAMGGGIALLLMAWGALQMISSAGNPENLKKGHDQFINAVMGLLIIILAVVLMQIIGVDILQIPGFG